MRRNWALIREIMLNLEAEKFNFILVYEDPDVFYYHHLLCVDAGYMSRDRDGMFCLTMKGYDFLELIRDKDGFEWACSISKCTDVIIALLKTRAE